MPTPRWGARRASLAALLILLSGLSSLVPNPSVAAPDVEPSYSSVTQSDHNLFAATNRSIPRLAIELDETALGILRLRSSGGERPRAKVTVREGARRYTNVSVQLKGFSSYRSIDDRPSLTLKFDRHVPGQVFHGLDKISLNNSLQDPTRLNEILARELFAAAGVPVPRATHAMLTLNGRDLGVYVLTEGYDKRFLGRHFERTDGTLYEGGTMEDIDDGPRASPEVAPDAPGAAALRQLISAAREPDPVQRFARLTRWLDVDRFLSMAAVETILCHSDSYTMNRNNYRFYHDPGTDRFVFMPHGMDRILGGHRSEIDLTIVPPQAGLISRALLTTAPGRQRYLARLAQLSTNQFQPALVCERLRLLNTDLLEQHIRPTLATLRSWRTWVQSQPSDAAELCRAVSARGADVAIQLNALSGYFRLPRIPRFGTNDHFPLRDWAHRPTRFQPAESLIVETEAGQPRLRLQSTSGPISMILIQRLTLPAGRYELTGRIQADAPIEAATGLTVSVHRWSGSRFQLQRTGLNPSALQSAIQVAGSYAPEEVELVCEIRSAATNLWLDVSSVALHRLARVGTDRRER